MDLSLCPSFNSYSNSSQLANDAVSRASRDLETRDDDDFEFEFASIPDLESLGDGEIRRAFPVFNRDLLSDRRREAATAAERSEEPILVPLRKLFLDDDGDRDRDRDPPSSSSSSEADELESVAAGTYCVWTPKPAASPSRCEKSSSTGSSSTAKQPRRWRIRDLLRRSNSEGAGKDSAMVLEKLGAKSAGKSRISAATGEKKAVSAHEKFYVRNRKLKEEDKRRSYLPYRQGLVGLFGHSNGNGMGTARTFPPF